MSKSKDWSEVNTMEETKSPTTVNEQSVRVLKKEDRLEAENLQLHIMLLDQRKTMLIKDFQTQLTQIELSLTGYKSKAEILQTRLWDEYGIDWQKEMIEPETGRIISKK